MYIPKGNKYTLSATVTPELVRRIDEYRRQAYNADDLIPSRSQILEKIVGDFLDNNKAQRERERRETLQGERDLDNHHQAAVASTTTRS